MPRLTRQQWAEVEVEWRSGAYSEVDLAKRWKIDRKSLREYRDRHRWARDLTSEIQARATAKTFAAEAERRGLKSPHGPAATPPGAAPQPSATHRKSKSKADSRGKTPQAPSDRTPPGGAETPTPAEDGPHAEIAEAAIERIVAVQVDINAEHLGRVGKLKALFDRTMMLCFGAWAIVTHIEAQRIVRKLSKDASSGRNPFVSNRDP